MKSKQGSMALLCAVLVGCLLHTAAGDETNAWAFKDLRAWSREKNAVKLAPLPAGAFEVRHTGGADWCVNGCPQIAVKHGDVFELSCETEPLADMPDSRTVCMSVILRDAKGVEVSWSYGEGHAKPGQPIQSFGPRYICIKYCEGEFDADELFHQADDQMYLDKKTRKDKGETSYLRNLE